MTEKFKQLMKLHGITYAELGREINRAPSTVKQRLDTETTFHKHYDYYREALEKIIKEKELIKEESLKEL